MTSALEQLETPYFVGGSLASALYGSYRSTDDADIVADIAEAKVDSLVAMLDEVFFVDDVAVRAAVRDRRNFNIFHRDTMFKVDVFVTRGSAFDAS